MSAVGDCYARLSTYAELTALVGQNIWRLRAPPRTRPPYIVISDITTLRHYTHQGYAGLQDPHLQISCYSENHDECERIRDQVIAAVEKWPEANPSIQGVMVDNFLTIHEPDVSDVFHIPIDIHFGYGV